MFLPPHPPSRVRPALRWTLELEQDLVESKNGRTRFEVCLVDLIGNGIGPAQRLLDLIRLLQ